MGINVDNLIGNKNEVPASGPSTGSGLDKLVAEAKLNGATPPNSQS